MSRPRQRRITKNPSRKVSRNPKKTNRISLSTVHPLVKKNWDQKLTLSQNYARLGLMCSLRGKAGGIGNEQYIKEEDTIVGKRRKLRELWSIKPVEEPSSSVDLVREAVRKGAVGVVMPDGQETIVGREKIEECLEENCVEIDIKATVIGKRPGHTKELLPIRQTTDLSTEFIIALEIEAANQAKSSRFCSEQELRVLIELIRKHKLDHKSMAKDMRLNKFQLTSGQLKRKLTLMGNYFNIKLFSLE